MIDAVLSFSDATLYAGLSLFVLALATITSLRFTGYPDLTIDGSYTIGAALFAQAAVHGRSLAMSLVLAAFAGALAGLATATLNRVLRIGRIIAGVLVMLLCIIAAPYIAGGSSVGLLQADNWLTRLQEIDLARPWPSPVTQHTRFIGIIVTANVVLAVLFLLLARSRYGRLLRYIGSSERPLVSRTRHDVLTMAGLTIANGLVAVSGALEAQRNGGFSAGFGVGTLLIALTILVLGESMAKAKLRRDYLSPGELLTAATVGVLVYSAAIQALLRSHLMTTDVRLTTTVALIVLLAFAAYRHPATMRLF